MVNSVIIILLGIGLIIVELFIFTIALLWVGISLIAVGLVGLFYPMNILYQLLLSFFIALFLMIIFEKKLKDFISKSDKEIKDDFCNEEGIGEIKNEMLYYKATYWNYISESNKKYYEGDKIKVKRVEKGVAYVE